MSIKHGGRWFRLTRRIERTERAIILRVAEGIQVVGLERKLNRLKRKRALL